MTSTPRQKVFCIGLNKTGTTSFGDALQAIGYRRLGWRGEINSRLMLRWYENKRAPFIEAANNHDVMEDLPWPLVYDWMEQAFPDARFVLTLRTSAGSWLQSMQGHIARARLKPHGDWFGHRMVYGSHDPVADAPAWLRQYEEHNESVRRYFADKPGKLLELVVGGGGEGVRLGQFLGIGTIDFPHSNRGVEGAEKRAVA